jgi:hypothetical protein
LVAGAGTSVSEEARFSLLSRGKQPLQVDFNEWRLQHMSILWIILIVILVLALLGFFSRGRW